MLKYSFILKFIFLLLLFNGIYCYSFAIPPQELNGLLLWREIKEALNEHPSPTSFEFIDEKVEIHCGGDYSCLDSTYNFLRSKLEQKFYLLPLIYLTQRSYQVAKVHGDSLGQAAAQFHLFRYLEAAGQKKEALLALDKSIQVHQALGNSREEVYGKMVQLEYSLEHRAFEEVFPQMEVLLREVESFGDKKAEARLMIRMLVVSIEEESPKYISRYVRKLRKAEVPSPHSSLEYAVAIHRTLGKAWLFEHQGREREAEEAYVKALTLSQREPSPWLEIHTFLSLAKLSWQLKQTEVAHEYLNSALEKAHDLEQKDLLTAAYQLKSDFARQEGNFKKALLAIEKSQKYKDEFEYQSQGFDIRQFNLLQENNKLTVAKKNQELKLKLKNTQLYATLAFAFMALLLTIILGISWIKVKNQKHALTTKNELIEAQAKRLKNLDQAKSQFFTNVSHEIRTPLTLMLAPIQTLMKEDDCKPKQKQLLRLASDSGQQLKLLVDEILDLSKLDKGKLTPKLKPTPLREYFIQHLKPFEPLAISNNIHYGYDIDLDPGIIGMVDRSKLRQILNNLLSNAFKFTPHRERIEAYITCQKEVLRIKISNSGSKIKESDLPHLFDRYYQGVNSPEGTGIGLAIAKGYTQLLEGDIHAYNLEGNGVAFELHFPIEVRAASKNYSIPQPLRAAIQLQQEGSFAGSLQSKDLSAIKNVNGQGKRLLLVEDNGMLRDYLSLILSPDFRIGTASNGKEALKIIENEEDFDLIISDLMMPVMDGWQLLEELKSRDTYRFVPTLLLTALAEKEEKLRALRLGVDDYLIKPFDEGELKARIKNLITNYEARKASALTHSGREDRELSEENSQWLKEFETYVREKLSDDTLSVPGLAEKFAMSESTLLRHLKRLTGLSPAKYIKEMRLEEARRLLERRSHNSVSEIANQVGYKSIRNFSKNFKEKYKVNPSRFMSS